MHVLLWAVNGTTLPNSAYRIRSRCGRHREFIDEAKITNALATQFNFYVPMPVLKASTTPQLWVRGSGDLEAPSAETATRIQPLITAGQRYTLALYPGAEHGMTEYELNPDGTRVSPALQPVIFR